MFSCGFLASDGALFPRAEAASKRHQERQSQGPSNQEGEASYYGREFNGRQMANGERFNPNSNSAAHRNLPLGTTAQVTNLANGRTATVKVEDRGPYARGRVIDLSPRIADELGMKHAGRAPVRITPIHLPERDEGRPARR